MKVKTIATLTLSVLLLNTNVSLPVVAEEPIFKDSKSNNWISVSALARQNDLHFTWDYEYPDVKVEISGPHDVHLAGESKGEIWESVDSGNSQGEYRFSAVRKISGSADNEANGSEPVFQEYVTSLRLGNIEQETSWFAAQSASASGQAAKTYLRYQTFIPDSYIGAPEAGCTPSATDQIFAGNGRGFDPNSSSFKTRFQVTVDWSSNGNVVYSRTVSPTKRYEMASNGLPILSTEVTATATNEGMVLDLRSTSSTLTHYKLEHSVTNPLCNELFTFPIWYKTDVWIARSGAYTVTNEYRKAPNHELYLKDSDESNWTALIQAPTYSMECFNKVNYVQFFCSGSYTSPTGSSR